MRLRERKGREDAVGMRGKGVELVMWDGGESVMVAVDGAEVCLANTAHKQGFEPASFKGKGKRTKPCPTPTQHLVVNKRRLMK
jgi:hypothetical protein